MFRFPTSFLLGPCKAVGVQTKLYVKTTAGESKWRRKPAGPGWRKRVGSLGSREVWLLLAFHHKKKKPSFIVFFQLHCSLKTSTCKFEIVNLSIISHALLGGPALVPFFPRCTNIALYQIFDLLSVTCGKLPLSGGVSLYGPSLTGKTRHPSYMTCMLSRMAYI